MTMKGTDLAWALRLVADPTATQRMLRCYPLLEELPRHINWTREHVVDGVAFRSIATRDNMPKDYPGQMIQRAVNKYRRMVLDEEGRPYVPDRSPAPELTPVDCSN